MSKHTLTPKQLRKCDRAIARIETRMAKRAAAVNPKWESESPKQALDFAQTLVNRHTSIFSR